MAKEYVVMKDGVELKNYKTLPPAKKLADAEGAEVFADGECVYSPVSDLSTPSTVPITTPNITSVEVMEEAVAEEPVVEPKVEQYTLTRKMNVREKPSLKANKLKVLEGGAVVAVTEVKDDWLHLTDGTFILYEGGKNAKKG